MAYRALRRVHLGNEVYAEPGEFVRSAMEWTNVNVWVNGGYIEEVPDSELPENQKTSAPKKAAEKAAPKARPRAKRPRKKE